jgi:pSer/pThr/pTyr-binding forkhead associated (FHA) protein
LIDLGSTNGSFINDQRLVAHQPRILRDGDILRLGSLVVQVNFK